jgi:ADP-heptose:LPS heptosyltransferase
MKILIIRFSSIGDIVLTTPVLRCLKLQTPGIEVHYCTKSSFKSLLEANPYIDKFHFLEEDLNSLIQQLKAEKYDRVIDLHNNLRTLRIKLKLQVPSMSFNKLNWEKWLMVNFKKNKLPHWHIVDRYMKTVEHLAVNYDGLGLDHFIPEKDQFNMATLPTAFRKGHYIYAIGGQHETKKLPLVKMKELISKINSPLLLVGGKEDQANGEELEKYGKSQKKQVLNLCGQLNLNQSASVIQQSQKVYTHDTGMMHIAAAFKKEVICIWGNTIPEFGMYPFQTKYSSWEVKGLSCRPCSKIGFDKCPKGHFKCMMNQELPVI